MRRRIAVLDQVQRAGLVRNDVASLPAPSRAAGSAYAHIPVVPVPGSERRASEWRGYEMGNGREKRREVSMD